MLDRELNSVRLFRAASTLLLAGLFIYAATGPCAAYARPDKTKRGGAGNLSYETHTLRLEDEKVWVNIYQHPARSAGDLVFVNLHDNENTSAEAARAHILAHGGRLVELVHGRGREVVIRRHGVLHRFDPNRMFTGNGLRQSLKYFHSLTKENMALASDFARQVFDLIGLEAGKTIVAVHNNTNGKLTINDFRPGGWYGSDARDVFINRAEDPDDFFFTNSPVLFRALKTLRYNVALMSVDPPDRGTLGNVVHAQGGVYVLVEAEHGHFRQQVRMLEAVGRLLVGNSPAGD